MLDIVLNILSMLGIILLILLGILLVVILLILFFPISYRINGEKKNNDISASVKANWLFGILRAYFLYPKPGCIVVKLLWFVVYDASRTDKNAEDAEQKGKTDQKGKNKQKDTDKQNEQDEYKKQDEQAQIVKTTESSNCNSVIKDNVSCTEDIKDKSNVKGFIGFITAKYEKIKYTILKIYDKIKHIWENIEFYKKLYQDEQTQGLLRHAGTRLQKIWKNIRPRKIKADIVFGTGSPDTTGYAMGIYGMLSPMFGKHVNVSPDFNEAVFEGEIYIAGHITIFQVTLHTIMVLTDKRLKLLIHRIKKHNNQDSY